MSKKCSICLEFKSAFYTRSNGNSRKDCKDCFNKKVKANYSRTRPKQLEARRENYKANKKKYNAQTAKWRKNNPDLMRIYKNSWKKRNRGKVNADWMLRYAKKKSATPKWLSKMQVKQIENIYKMCPPGYHVDHIIPLRGKLVSGLHVPWNLQHLPAMDNVKKGNRVA